jgi:hypothetical protein
MLESKMASATSFLSPSHVLAQSVRCIVFMLLASIFLLSLVCFLFSKNFCTLDTRIGPLFGVDKNLVVSFPSLSL